jgi:hypothetical protein
MSVATPLLTPAIGFSPDFSERHRKRLRNARARRKLEKLHEEILLQQHLAEVWEEPMPERDRAKRSAGTPGARPWGDRP